MRAVKELAILYLKQCQRHQIFALPVLLGVFLAILPHMITAFSMSAFDRVARGAYMTLINVLMVGLAVVLGGTAVPGEIERRSLYPLLARPLSRYRYLTGKMLGIAGALAISLFFCGVCATVGLSSLTGHFEWRMMVGTACYCLEGCVLAAGCLVISTFSTAPVAVAVGLLMYFLGGLSNAYVTVFLLNSHRFWLQYALVVAFKAVVPHFDVFHVKDAIVHDDGIDGSYFTSLAMYGLAWVALQLSVADWLFARRDV